jgi:hypothetical protein
VAFQEAWLTEPDTWADDRPPIWKRPASLGSPARSRATESLLLDRPRRSPMGAGAWPGLVSRRTATIAVPAIVLVALAVLALALLMCHGPKFGQLAGNANAGSAQPPRPTAALATYPGQQQRGVFQTVNRIVAYGRTMVATGSQASDGVIRQQFFVSADGGASWRLAPVRGAGGGQAPVGHPAALLAGGPGAAGGWLAIGPQAIWTSQDGASWTLAATHGITPQLPGDSVWVITKTAQGYLAAGAGGSGPGQAVLWTSRDGLAWQRLTAGQLGLAAAGESVRSISYASYHGDATVISGQITAGAATYSGAWLSTNGGSAWTRVRIPADHGAQPVISGLAFDAAGLLAVRAGVAANGAPDGVAYFSQNGQAWQYAGTIAADPGTGGWSPGVVKGSDDGFVVTGTTAENTIVAYASTGTGGTWQPTGSLGDSGAESVVSATVGPGGTVVAVGYTAATKLGQQPVLLVAGTAGTAGRAGRVRPVPLAAIPGGLVPELAVNGLAADGGQMVAVGSADGYPAVWHRSSGGSWSLVTSPSLAAELAGGLTALTSVTHGAAGWLAVGGPGPVLLTSPDGTNWRPLGGPITRDLAGASAVTAAASPAGYVIARTTQGGGTPDIWWSQDLRRWTHATSMNFTSGSSRVLAAAADGRGFLAVGSHDHQPAVWATSDGGSWTAIVLGLPAGASSAVLEHVAVSGNRVVALGQQQRPGGTVPLAEMSANGGTSWQVVPFPQPGPGTAVTALTADPGGGFTAAAQYGAAGQRQAAAWTSPGGAGWTQSQGSALTGSGVSEIAGLAPAGSAVIGIGVTASATSQQTVTITLPAT